MAKARKPPFTGRTKTGWSGPHSAEARAKLRAANYAHGQSGGGGRRDYAGSLVGVVWPTRTYSTWQMIISQCDNPRTSGWALHGGRGVKVCPRWRQDFRNFLSDMGPRPDGMGIRRIRPLGDYEPGNCVWAPSRHARPEGVHRPIRKRAKKRVK